jgi:hypothetical protein
VTAEANSWDDASTRERSTEMTDPTSPRPEPGEPAPSKTEHDTTPGPVPGWDPGTSEPGASSATGLLESFRSAIDDLFERATPAVREFSAKAAETAASAADKAAPLARRAGEATADASGKLAIRSRTWAADVRASVGGAPGGHEASGGAMAGATDDVPPAAQPTPPEDAPPAAG